MIIDHDVIVLGAGLAGMRSALEAARNGADVAVVTKVHPLRSHERGAGRRPPLRVAISRGSRPPF